MGSHRLSAPGLASFSLAFAPGAAAVLITSCLLISPALARTGPAPFSFSASVADLSVVPASFMPPVDVDRFLREDQEQGPGPMRFAAAIETDMDASAGLWEEVPGGARLWRIRIASPGALNLNLAFIPFHLPPGATLHLYTPDRGYVEGPFHAGDGAVHRELWTPVVPADEVVVELFVPSRAEFEPELKIARVNHGYRHFGGLDGSRGKQGSCNIDVICPEGDPWRDEIRSVVVYQRGGTFACTGSLVNSWVTAPASYILTANHCSVTDANDHTVVVYWNFQSPVCGQLSGGSLTQNQTGATWRASYAASDFTLFELNQAPDPSFNAHYAGWDRSGAYVSESTVIHHPSCDEKALAFDLDPLTTTSYYGTTEPGDGTHWRVGAYENGTTERGSSGSGLWDHHHRIVGQLHGGEASCDNPAGSDYYGKLSVSWEGGGAASSRLRDWLDPFSLGVLRMDGSEGVCASLPLTSGTAVEPTGTPRFYTLNQATNYWTAVGVRASGTDDWDLELHDASGAYPECVSGLHAASRLTTPVDFVIGDYNHCPAGEEWTKVSRYSGSENGVVEWDSGSNQIIVNGPLEYRTTGPADVLEAWDVFLEAGRAYLFDFYASSPVDGRFFLFRNPTSEPYWRGRSAAVLESVSGVMYTAPANDWYGVVVVNENGGVGSYRISVRTCVPPAALTSGLAVSTPPAFAYYSFAQGALYWSAAGVRGDSSSDWDIRLYLNGSGDQPPLCFSTQLASSQSGTPFVDFVIADFNHTARGTYYVLDYNYYQTYEAAMTEWDDGTDILTVDGAATIRTTGHNDVLEVWDLYLEENRDYVFLFDRSGSADTELLLFQSGGGFYTVDRSAAVLTTSSAATPFRAPVTDWYGVVVVNDNGGAGGYSLRVTSQSTGVDEIAAGRLPERTILHALVPNPSRGSVTVRFSLASPAHVELDVTDVSGRGAASAPPRHHPAGTWIWTWDGKDGHGREVPAGVYWIRMTADHRVVGREQVVMVR